MREEKATKSFQNPGSRKFEKSSNFCYNIYTR
jgi:hypothetical protein